VLRGGDRVLRELRPTILLEIQPTTLKRAGSSAQHLADLLASRGYILRRAEKDRLVPLEVRETPGYLVNAFAIPTG